MAPADRPSDAGLDPQLIALVERHAAALEEGRFADAGQAADEVMAFVLEEAQSNPTPDILRGMMADQAEADGQWDVARRIYEEELGEALQETVPLAKFAQASRCKQKLAYLEFRQGRNAAAFELAREAVEFARLGESELSLAMTIEQFAGFALRAGRPQDAIDAVDEALNAVGERKLFALTQGQLLLRRGEAALAMSDVAAARTALEGAKRAIEPMLVHRGAGVTHTAASGWTLEAKLLGAENDWQAARAAWENAVSLRQQVAESWEGHWSARHSLAQTMTEFADAAEAASDAALAATLRADAERVRGPQQSCNQV